MPSSARSPIRRSSPSKRPSRRILRAEDQVGGAGCGCYASAVARRLPMSRVAFVLADDFEDSEFRKPYDALKAAGHDIDVIGVKAGATVKGKKGDETVTIDKAVVEASAADYDAL